MLNRRHSIKERLPLKGGRERCFGRTSEHHHSPFYLLALPSNGWRRAFTKGRSKTSGGVKVFLLLSTSRFTKSDRRSLHFLHATAKKVTVGLCRIPSQVSPVKIAVACPSALAKSNMSGLEKGVEVIPRSKSSQTPPATFYLPHRDTCRRRHCDTCGRRRSLIRFRSRAWHGFNKANGLTCSRRLGDAREEVKVCRMSLFSLRFYLDQSKEYHASHSYTTNSKAEGFETMTSHPPKMGTDFLLGNTTLRFDASV